MMHHTAGRWLALVGIAVALGACDASFEDLRSEVDI